MAALAAARHGRTVCLLEKARHLGGTTGLSVGTIAATATRLQAAAGIDDGPQSHFEDMAKFAGPLANRDNPELRRILVENAPETIQILCDLGVEFIGPLPEAPHSHPRLHAVLPHSRSFIHHLHRACARLGVTIRTGCGAETLLRDADGRVTGVVAGGRRLTARRGVVLTSGDFSAAPRDYKARHMTGPMLDLAGINANSTGDGQRMAEDAGAQVVNGDLAWGPELRFHAPRRPGLISRLPVNRWFARALKAGMKVLPAPMLRRILLGFVTTYLAPSPKLFAEGAVLVNREGARFCDERDRPQDHFGDQTGQEAFIIMDDRIARLFAAWPNFISTAPGVGFAYLPDYARTRPDLYASAPTVAGLARKLGLPPAAVEAAVAAANAERAGTDAAPLVQGPFHALGPARAWIVFGDGGLAIDREFRVCNAENRPIPGLYAAGSAGQGGVLLEGHGHHLAWAFTSGRLAGRNAALAVPTL